MVKSSARTTSPENEHRVSCASIQTKWDYVKGIPELVERAPSGQNWKGLSKINRYVLNYNSRKRSQRLYADNGNEEH